MVSGRILTLCYDARILSEYREVLHRPKFGFESTDVDALLDQIKASGRVVVSEPLVKSLPDSGDEPFLEVAIAGKGKCLITGNLKHYPSDNRQGIRALSPVDFLAWYRKARL